MSGWMSGVVPRAREVFRAADVLNVSPRWLLNGDGPKREAVEPEADLDTVVLPLFEISAFSEEGKPEPRDQVPVRVDWLLRTARRTQGLWLAEMPSDAMPDLAREGDTLICQDVTPPLVEGRYYIFLLYGRPLVRKVHLRRDGLVLQSGDASAEPIVVGQDGDEELIPIGRVVAAISLRSV